MTYRTLSSGTCLSNIVAWSLALTALFTCLGAQGADRSAYKYTDEKGNVVYSQTPPAGAKEAKKVDITPALRNAGGSLPRSLYDSASLSSERQERPLDTKLEQLSYSAEVQDRHVDRRQEELKKAEAAKRNRRVELEAECNRNRGTDCKNPEVLQMIEFSRIAR